MTKKYTCCVCSDEIDPKKVKNICKSCGDIYHPSCGDDEKCDDCQLVDGL